ncbi:HxlR family transcriptional regulator [Paracoccus pantotrophus]|jgi:DNA-binding HxlR family transcriptional regulator|uniref:Helix-turn-helix transcriptional regulator n=1 Tax=Paracoccus pantotrophus TaxID=82367 RepID=A0AAE6TT07_PARPN|nr:helix-turn-helix domain-containing protein [Paracoccus pantotrophus]QFG36074.1 helix-turn-helix transcriptional regulator [Paracoccus pantotrophus]RKS42658.1 HxlR family transcriptional regulator [Paracoccus pantotrophus]
MPEPKAATAAVCRPDECLAEDWLAFLGHRWNALLLWHLSSGPRRYSELQALLPRISPKVLTDRIAGLTRRNLVQRTETNTYPREVTYRLTARGEALRTILSELYDWAADVVHEDALAVPQAAERAR